VAHFTLRWCHAREVSFSVNFPKLRVEAGNLPIIWFPETLMQQAFTPNYVLFADNSPGTKANGSSMSVLACSQ
jgi:hypothetical protein